MMVSNVVRNMMEKEIRKGSDATLVVGRLHRLRQCEEEALRRFAEDYRKRQDIPDLFESGDGSEDAKNLVKAFFDE